MARDIPDEQKEQLRRLQTQRYIIDAEVSKLRRKVEQMDVELRANNRKMAQMKAYVLDQEKEREKLDKRLNSLKDDLRVNKKKIDAIHYS